MKKKKTQNTSAVICCKFLKFTYTYDGIGNNFKMTNSVIYPDNIFQHYI